MRQTLHIYILWQLGSGEGLEVRTRQGVRVQSLKRRFITLGFNSYTSARCTSKTGGCSSRGPRVRRAAHCAGSRSSASSSLPLDSSPSVGWWPPFNTWVPPAQVFLVSPIAALGRSGFVAGCWPPAVYPGLDSPEQGAWHRGYATIANARTGHRRCNSASASLE